MSDDIPSGELDRRTWEVFERALDAAIAAEPGDVAALELGVRVAELLMNSRIVAPPRARAASSDEANELEALLEPPTRFEVRVGKNLANDDAQALVELLKEGRRQLAREYGVVTPGARVRPGEGFADGEFEVFICGDSVLRAVVSKAESQASEVAQRVTEVASEHLAEFLSREEAAELLNVARRESPMVVQELVPNMLALGQLRAVLRNLVKEKVPIRDLSTILNALADNAVYTKDPHALTEHVRQALGRKLCTRYQDDEGNLNAFLLSPDAERAIQNAIQLNETGQVLMLDPNTSAALQHNLVDALGKHQGEFAEPILIVPPKIRRHVKALFDRNFEGIVVLSYSELVPGTTINNLEMIEPFAPGQRPTPPPPTAADADASLVKGAADHAPDEPGWNW